ncbi:MULTISPECIES: hypothetical protein [Streptomyces]|nr:MULTISPECIES: hypothetical protein [Streptomyces]
MGDPSAPVAVHPSGLLFDGDVFADLLKEIHDNPGDWRDHEFPEAP